MSECQQCQDGNGIPCPPCRFIGSEQAFHQSHSFLGSVLSHTQPGKHEIARFTFIDRFLAHPTSGLFAPPLSRGEIALSQLHLRTKRPRLLGSAMVTKSLCYLLCLVEDGKRFPHLSSCPEHLRAGQVDWRHVDVLPGLLSKGNRLP